ncbi:retrovirus-related pol polyprotein from transposon TNT 1-94 [Tanacetum coccineum]
MTTLAEHIIVARAENRPSMLEKSMYDSWASRIHLFIKGNKHGRMMLDFIDNGLLVYLIIEENRQTRPMKYSELTEAQQLQDECDVQATNIILHGLPPNVFSQLINDMHTIGVTMQQVQVNTKFLNALPSEWSKFVTDVKLAKSLYTTNYDQMYAYLSQHERHANEVRITRERYSDPLAFVANSPTLYNPSQSPQHSGCLILAVPMFQQGEDPIECVNKAMTFLSVVASRFPPSNNQLRTSSNPRNQPTIQDGKVTVQQVQERQTQSYTGTGNRGIATTSKGNYAAGQPRVVKCYNYCDDLSSAKAVLLANLSSCDPEVLSELPYSDSYSNDMINQDVQEMQYSKQTHIDDFQDNEIHSDSNIISEKVIDSQMDDLILDRNAKLADFQQEIDTLKETLSNNVKEKHAVISMIDDEETLILEEESQSKMLDKQNDPISIEKKIKISPIDYSKLNKIKEDFGKRFVTKKELSAEQAFWLKHSSLSETPVTSHTPVRIEAPSELPKVSLVNESLKKLKYQLANFDKVVKKRLTSDAITAGSWGFEHTKECFVTEIIPFLKVLKDTFNAFDKTLLDEITEVQTVFNQMEAAVDQCSVDKNVFEIQIKQLRIDNDQLLNQIMSQEIVHIVAKSVNILDVKKSCVNDCSKCLELETELLKKKDFIEKEAYDKLVKIYSTLEKHCISLELATQHNQEIFQRENSGENLNASTFNQLFEINELKAQSQEKDTVIRKLKDIIKYLSGKDSVEIKEREHLKSIYKDQFDSIRKTRVQSKEHCDSLIAQINAKSIENSDLNAQLQEKVFAITTFKNKFRKLKGKNVVDTAVSKPKATIAPGMFKLDIEPISHRLKNNRDAHEVYIEKTIQYTDTLRGFVKRARTQNPSQPLLESACMFTKHVQELFDEPVTSSSNIPKQTDFLKTKDSNKSLLTSTRVKLTTSASRSKPSGNTKNNRITRAPSSNQKNKVEDHYRKVKSSLNMTNSVSEPISNALVKHSVRNAKFESICAICNKCLFDANHDMCLIDFVNDVNVCSKSRSKRNKMRKVWKPTVETPKPEIKVYSRRPKQIKSVSLSKKTKIIESKTANNLEPTHLWGSNATDVPSSSSFVIDRSKDEALDTIIKCIKNIQVRLNATVRNVRTDNRTEFVNQTLRDFYENVGISHQTFVARTPQQNDVIERRNQTLVEVARTMLIFSKAHLEDLGKLNAKAAIGIFVGYTPAKKAFRIYNRTRLQVMTPTTSFPVAAAPRAVDIADSPVSTSIDKDVPSTSIPSTKEQEHSPIISQGVEESPKTPPFHNDPLYEFLHEDSTSQGSSSNVRPSHNLFELIGR